ncbi:hypothetical protein GSI_07844 [Ganoderma sinense ZZ0214-1]|uniref:F-box domain-containing protein n=1 Tax=Ganoderma sinense ZZ0214-1 TaxID=1077348 RepID=A0A2G8S829_9APHY|nr:hypothetical protein GSI_07844 [Ganoderma sinense ZZ0214-1]
MQFLQLPFPTLESFSLTGSDRKMSRQTRNPSSLPLSGTNASRLRYLSLGLTTLLPLESGFPRLTHLSLSRITAPNLHSRITDLLRDCPLLTSLVLRKLQCSTRIATLDFWRPMAPPDPLPLRSGSTESRGLARVILADMDPNLVEYYAALFSHHRPCLQIPISERDPFASREREVFGALYRQYSHGAEDTDVSRLCVTTHAVDHSHTSDDSSRATRGFSVTLANSTNLLRVAVWPKLLERDPYGRRNWRTDVLAPLRALSGVREVWFENVDMIMDCKGLADASATVSLWNLSESDPTQLGVDGARGGLAQALPALANVVIVHNCSSRLRVAGPIQPSIAVLPKRPRAAGPSLEHLRLAIGYDTDDLPRLHGFWRSPLAAADSSAEPRLSQGKVDFTTNLLSALTSDRNEYAYVKHARLVVQVMPHLVLDAEELERLRGFFAAVDVEKIDRLPTMPVPERVRDEMLDLRGFIPGSVLC